MSFADLGDCRVHYELEGDASAPLLVLSNSLGADMTMWDSQMKGGPWQSWRVLRYDTRGHGKSSVTPGPYSIQQLAEDVIRLLDYLNEPDALFCGLSMGGLIGMWLGRHDSHRIRKLVLCNTAVRIGTPESWRSRIEAVRAGGTQAIAASVVERWFSAGFRCQNPETVQSFQELVSRTSPEGYIACCEAIRDADLQSSISGIHVPAAVIAGTYDVATTPADARYLADHIPGARYIELPAAHLSNVECSARFNEEVSRFLEFA
jgi:3-oxoadipate enol-lactonase